MLVIDSILSISILIGLSLFKLLFEVDSSILYANLQIQPKNFNLFLFVLEKKLIDSTKYQTDIGNTLSQLLVSKSNDDLYYKLLTYYEGSETNLNRRIMGVGNQPTSIDFDKIKENVPEETLLKIILTCFETNNFYSNQRVYPMNNNNNNNTQKLVRHINNIYENSSNQERILEILNEGPHSSIKNLVQQLKNKMRTK